MSTTTVPWTREDFDRHAREFEATLQLEDLMENTRTAQQRTMTLAMFELLRQRDPRIQAFNELLVQYEADGIVKGVVPDNMLVLTSVPARDRNSFPMPLEPDGPFLVIEYVSKGSEDKDYETNLDRYALIGVPYYVIFDPQASQLEVHRLLEGDYVRLEPGLSGRVSVPELDLDIGLLNGWMRLWHHGELLKVTNELQQENESLEQEKTSLAQEKKTLVQEKKALAQENKTLVQEKTTLAKEKTTLVQENKLLEQKNRSLEEEKDSLQEATQQFLDWLRRSVEAKAKKLGRQDVVTRVPTADLGQLQQWQDEL